MKKIFLIVITVYLNMGLISCSTESIEELEAVQTEQTTKECCDDDIDIPPPPPPPPPGDGK